MFDYIKGLDSAWVYDNDGMNGCAMSIGMNSFDYRGSQMLYGSADGLGGYVIRGDSTGFTLPNVCGGQDYYSENGYDGTLMPFPDF